MTPRILLALAFSLLGITALLAAPVPADTLRVSLVEHITGKEPRSQAFQLDLEMHAGFYSEFSEKKVDEVSFRFQDIKVDISGQLTDRLFYEYRQKLNADFSNSTLENLSESIEYAYIGYDLSDRFTLTAGKQDVLYGSYEYDLNPLHIYQYSDMNEYSLCYLLGLTLGIHLSPAHDLNLQITNSRMGDMEYEYGHLPEDVEKPVAPLFYTLNWDGHFLDDLFSVKYSASAAAQAKKKYLYTFAAGHCLETEQIHAYFDVMYSRGALDPLGLLTELDRRNPDSEETAVRMQNCDYLSLIAEIQYRFHPKWKVFAKGTYETGGVYRAYDDIAEGRYRTAWGYQAGLEFYPMADDNMRLFLMGLGKSYQLTEQAYAINGELDNTARLSVGFIYRLPLY